MSFFSGITNAVSGAIGGLGHLAESACDAVLPPQLEFVGDLASGVVNYATGNYAGLAQDALDLGQNVASGVRGLVDGFCRTEPEPPRHQQGHWGEPHAGFLARALDLAHHHHHHTSHGQPSSAAGPPAPGVTVIINNGSGAAGSAGGTSAAGGANQATAAGGWMPAAGTGNLQGDAQNLLNLANSNPQAFMSQVANGNIPDSLKTKEGMMALQENMNRVQEMFALMTTIMKAMHDMRMSCIQNLRG